MATGGSFSGVKLPGREANHSPSPSAEVKIGAAIHLLPPSVLLVLSLIKNRENCLFFYTKWGISSIRSLVRDSPIIILPEFLFLQFEQRVYVIKQGLTKL
jgi:hypothetical protein